MSLRLSPYGAQLEFAVDVEYSGGRDRYPYVSHLVCNAGVAPFLRISWPLFLQQFLQDTCRLKPFEFAVHPRFNIQRTSIMSEDGLGWAWQCNVFGHYIIVRFISHPSSLLLSFIS